MEKKRKADDKRVDRKKRKELGPLPVTIIRAGAEFDEPDGDLSRD